MRCDQLSEGAQRLNLGMRVVVDVADPPADRDVVFLGPEMRSPVGFPVRKYRLARAINRGGFRAAELLRGDQRLVVVVR